MVLDDAENASLLGHCWNPVEQLLRGVAFEITLKVERDCIQRIHVK